MTPGPPLAGRAPGPGAAPPPTPAATSTVTPPASPGTSPPPAPVYDAIAGAYQRTRHSPVRRWIERYTLARLLGPVQGLRVLDAGCGDGWYARQLRAAGAAAVTAVDVSPAMLALAAAEPPDPGIRFHCLDAAALPVLGDHDIVLAAYLLHYAPDPTVLAAMTAGLARNLRPGGRLVALVENPAPVVDAEARYAVYGFSRELSGTAAGSPIRYALVAGRELVRFDTFYYGADDYAAALGSAGFAGLAWHGLELDPEAPGEPAWYHGYLREPPVLGLTAERAA